ncbi:MAG: flagellar M-ring protein FliF [Planctomycetes bacterium]|nr:flagellar M-ring protein FliF [Planctomycetota bacterium]
MAVISVLALVGVAAWIVVQARTSELGLLYAELDPEDAARVVEHLKAGSIPHQIRDGGRAIYAPQEQISELRLDLLVDGKVGARGGGLELFERGTFGQSAFAEQVTYTRALQGELARTISGLDPVSAASVHVGRSRETPFMRAAQPPTASVALRLRPGRTLSPRQLAGVRALIAASVPRLEAARITILDQTGAVLGGGTSDGEPSGAGYERERSLEKHLVQKAQSLLDQAYGPRRAIVRVNVVLNRTAVEERKEELAREGVPTQESVTTRTKTLGPRRSSGAGAESSANDAQESESEEVERTTYSVGRSTRHSTTPAGGLKRLTIGVLLDASLEASQAEIGIVVKEAIGYDSGRGDTFQITSLAFERAPEGPEEPDPRTLVAFERLIRSGLSLVLVLAGVSVIVFFANRHSRARSNEPSPRDEASTPPSQGEVAPSGSDREDAGTPAQTNEPAGAADPLRDTAALIQANPLGAGVVLERWLTADSEGES